MKLKKGLLLLTAALLLVSCSSMSSGKTALPEQTREPSPSLSSAARSAVSTTVPEETATQPPASAASFAALPLPSAVQEDLIGSLPDPGLWASSLHIDAKDYPRVDGSTATIPLGIFIRSKITGESLQQSLAATSFTKTGPAWLALANKKADLLIVYEAPDGIREQLSGLTLNVKPIGMDALVFLTNRGNPVNSLTQKQIVDIYSGKVTNWKQAGGRNAPIVPYQRVSGSGSQALMLKLVMKDTGMMDAPDYLMPTEMGDLINDLALYDNTNNALGYSVYYYVRNMYTVPGVKLLAVDGVAPGNDTIASGAYPFVSPFYAVIRADEPDGSTAHKIFDWLTGGEGKRAISDAGYVAAK